MSCDAELQELMIQVDKMVEDKKLEWQEKIKSTENKLSSILQENFNLKSIIEDKNNELANFKNRIKYKDNMSNIFDYDQEVLQLRLELSQIKKSYEKYYHKYTKKTKEIEKNKEELCKEKIDLLKEINELRNSQKQLSEDNTKHKDQISDLELKKSKLSMDRDALNDQLKLLKSDFNNQLSVQVESEKKYAQNLKELENKLNESNNCLQHEIEENKTKISDIMQHMKKTLDEKQQLLIDNESAKRLIIRLENELSRFSTDNKVKDKNICKMEQILKVSEKTINEKNEVIRALQVNTAPKDYVNILSKLESELVDAKSNLKLAKKSEKSLQIDCQSLQKKLQETSEIIENERNMRGQIEISLEQISNFKTDKNNLLDKIGSLENVIEQQTSEISNMQYQMDKVKQENQQLIIQLNHEKDIQMKNNDVSIRCESRRQSEEDISNHTTESMIKERNCLLKFCEDKDSIIHRLQMENRILQEFISKLNNGLSSDMVYFNPDSMIDNCVSISDVFHPLKETFTELDQTINIEKSSENHNQNNYLSSQIYKKPANEFISDSSESFPNLNYYREIQSEIVNKSSDQFLSKLIRSESTEHKANDNESYMNVYPTLAAAKYFTEEREKTKQIERMIDYHMNQLKKDTDSRCNKNNH